MKIVMQCLLVYFFWRFMGGKTVANVMEGINIAGWMVAALTNSVLNRKHREEGWKEEPVQMDERDLPAE